MNDSLKRMRLLFVLNLGLVCHAQSVEIDSVDATLGKIDMMVKQKELYPEIFLNPEFLLAKYKRVSGEERVRTLLRLYTSYIYKSTDTAKKFNSEAKELSLKIGYDQGELSALYNDAYLLFVMGRFEDAMNLMASVKKRVDFAKDPTVYADFATLRSDIYTERGQYDLALETGLKLLDLAEKSGNDYAHMKANAALSHYYLRIENYRKALSYCIRGIDFIIKLREMKYIFQKVDEIARMTAKLGNSKKALEVYDFYLNLEKKLPPPGSYIQSVVYMNMAEIYMDAGNFIKAQDYLSRSLRLCLENNYGFRIPRAYYLEGELSLNRMDTLNAILNYEKSLEAAESINAFGLVKSTSAILGELYEKSNRFAKAYEYKTLHKAILDSLFSNEKDQRIIILEARRKIKDVTQQNKILELEYESQQDRYRNMILIVLSALIFTTLAILAYLKLRTKNRILYDRTIELAQVQLGLQDQLSIIKNGVSHNNVPGKNGHNTDQIQTIDEELKNIILGKLEKLEKSHFFLDQGCNLHQLAEKLKTNHKYLSQVINQEKKSNFNNYINELRINYLLARLLKDEEFRNNKLSYIAVSVGYNNLNTFNAAFKKRQGILPSYFIDQLNSKANA